MTHYLGIDASQTGTGIALLDDTGALLLLTTVGSKPNGTSVRARVFRHRGLAAAMCHELATVGPLDIACCCIEQYSYGSNGAGHSTIIECGYELRSHLVGIVSGALLEVAPTTLKKWATGKGVGDKSAVVSALTKRYGVEFSNDNEADAYALARMALQCAGGEVPANEKQREAVKTVLSVKVKPTRKRAKAKE